LFPSGNQPPRESRGDRPPREQRGRQPDPVEDDDETDEADNTDDPSALANADMRANLNAAVEAVAQPEDEPPESTSVEDDDFAGLPDEDPSRDPNAED
jgi:hypothetical protein